MRIIIVALILLSFEFSHAWGRRGHSIVGTTAGYLVSEEVKDDFYKSHSYDLGYYANTPDFIWKEPATYAKESKQHYHDKEIFDRGLKDYKGPDPLEMSREQFDEKFPQIPLDAGRAFWRVRELYDLLSSTSEILSKSDLTKQERFGHQANWLLTAGVIGHYIGDLGQPLHVTENFNGQLSKQEGIHSFFEDTIVDEYYGSLEQKVMQEARKRWKQFHKKNADKSILTLLKDMTEISYADLDDLLKIDKKMGKRDIKKGSSAYRGMVEERITVASLYLAEILVRQTKWTPNNDLFFNFYGRPPYIEPGKAAQLPPVTSLEK